MKQKLIGLSRRYVAALQKYLGQGARADLRPALGVGRRAVALGLETLDLARTHEQALLTLKLSGAKQNASQIKQAEIFFSESLLPIVETQHAARQSKIDLGKLNEMLNRRTAELAVTNRQLERGVIRRNKVEAALASSERHYTKLLKDSLQLQQGLRQLTHQVLAAQENERKQISLELKDEIAQTLLGINVRLLTLKGQARTNTKGLKHEIASTQRLVAESARYVRQAARRFRNA